MDAVDIQSTAASENSGNQGSAVTMDAVGKQTAAASVKTVRTKAVLSQGMQ